MVVLDTCALVFWTLDPQQLSPEAEAAINQASVIIVSSISIWEIGLKVKKSKLVIPLTIQEYVKRVQAIDNLTIQPIDEKIWLHNLELDWNHNDPADRSIVAAASILNCPLITSDEKIRQFYKATIW